MIIISKPDYLYMLDDLDESLQILKMLERECIKGSKDIRKLQKEVKRFASDVESTLDYLAFYLHEKIYLPREITNDIDEDKIEKLNKKVSFPFVKYADRFEKDLNKKFPDILDEYPVLADLIKSVQPFNYSTFRNSWLYTANQLANKSKHRKLTQVDDRKDAFIENVEFPNNIVIRNNTFINVKNTIVINGVPLTKDNATALGGKNYRGLTISYYIIEDLNLKLIDTLEWILRNLTILVNKIDKEFKNINI